MPAPQENTSFLKKKHRLPKTSPHTNLKEGTDTYFIGLIQTDGLLGKRDPWLLAIFTTKVRDSQHSLSHETIFYWNLVFIVLGGLHTFEPWVEDVKWTHSTGPRISVKCTSLDANKHHCSPDPCSKNSKCYGGPSTYYCHCDLGWTGNTCTIESKFISFQIIYFKIMQNTAFMDKL